MMITFRLLTYAAIFLLCVYLAYQLIVRIRKGPQISSKPARSLRKKDSRELWVQVYDTGSLDEARGLQARFEEEEIECFLYEQGRKDVHGNSLKGFGVAVPKTSIALAQRIIASRPA